MQEKQKPYDPQGEIVDISTVKESGWVPVPLEEIIADAIAGKLEIPRPTVCMTVEGAALFYSGAVNGVHGESGSGKSWTALYAVAQELKAGHNAYYIDYESDEREVVVRLLALGSTATDLARLFYFKPQVKHETLSMEILGRGIAQSDVTIIVIDSVGEGLAMSGANPDKDQEVAEWYRTFPRYLADLGPAVVTVDHVTKAGSNALWPIGSQRKRAAVTGALYLQATVSAFSRGESGLAELRVAKDRKGHRSVGATAAYLQTDGSKFSLVETPSDPSALGSKTTDSMIANHFLETVQTVPGILKTELAKSAKGKTDRKNEVLARLIADDFIRVEKMGRAQHCYIGTAWETAAACAAVGLKELGSAPSAEEAAA